MVRGVIMKIRKKKASVRKKVELTLNIESNDRKLFEMAWSWAPYASEHACYEVWFDPPPLDIVFTYTLQRTNQKVIFLEYLYFLSIYIHIHARSYNDPNHYIMLYPLDPQLPLHATKVKNLVKFHSLEVSIFYVQECYG